MARSLSLLFLITCLTAIAFVAIAEEDEHHHDPHKHHHHWIHIHNAKHNHHVQELGKFAVKRHNEQTHDHLRFKLVTDAWKLVRAPEHLTYKLIIEALDGIKTKFYVSEVLEDKSAPGKPPVHNFGPLKPL